MDVFIQTFHSITGKTISDKQKNFNVLLQNVPPDHDTLIASIVPQNNFENLLKLKLLLKLKRLPDLIQILKNEDEYLPAKLLKNRWFCQQLAAILDEKSEGFVEDLLPYTSYVIRRRIIAKLATFGTKLDRLFEEVRARYGIHNAAPLLAACSGEKVANVCESDDKIVLAPLFQKLLYRKHPVLFPKYVKTNLKNLDNVDPSVISYIAKCNMLDFEILTKEFNYVDTNLGKRLTRKFLINNRDLIIEKSLKFSRVLHIKTLIKMLSETEFKNFFSNCFPPDFHNNWLHCGYAGSNIRKQLGDSYYRYLFEIFSEKYNKSLYDFPDTVSEELMTSMTTEERLKWVAIKMRSGKTDDWIPFMKTCDSIPVIKNKINVTSSIDKRGDLVRELLKTCKINKDLNALVEVCEYVSCRHRNDDESILASFLYQLQSSFQLENLDERHWKSINTIVEILCRKSSGGYYMYDFQLEYMEFLHRHKKLDDNDIINFVKRVDFRPYQKCSDELKKVLFLKKIEYAPTLLKQDEKLEYEDLKLICCILGWNNSHRQEKIEIFAYPRLVSSLEKCLLIAEKHDCYIRELTGLDSIFETFICTKQRSSFRDSVIEKYFLMNFRFHSLKIDFWLLKNDPDIIYKHFDEFLDHMIHANPSVSFLNFIKTYTDSNFQERVLNHYLGILENQEVVFRPLVILHSPEKFLQFIAPFYPSSDKIEDTEDGNKTARIAKAIASSFKYASSTLVLPALVTYCKGDYLGSSLESLYYRFYRSPENRLRVFINDLSSKAVSVRKHSIFLTCIVGSVPDVQNLLRNFIKTEKNISVLKHLCTATWRYFVKNPTDEFWEDLKMCMTKLDKNDTESFNMLVKLHHIPKEYQSRHVIFVWEILKMSEDKHRPRLLSSIPRQLFADFPLEFLIGVISENLFKPGASCETTINDFIVSCLIESVHKNDVANLVFNIMKTLNVAKNQSLEKEKCNREMLGDFVSSIISGLAAENNNFDTLRAFSNEWHALFPPLGAMREHLKLSFALMYVDSGKDLVKFATPLAHFFENFVSTYSLVLVDCFASELVNSLKICQCSYGDMGEDFFRLCLHLVNLQNFIFQLLVVKMLPVKQPTCEGSKQLFLQIVQFLRGLPQESIQVLMNLYVIDLE